MADLVQMEDVNDATIVHNLKQRAKKEVIYVSKPTELGETQEERSWSWSLKKH